MRSRVVVPSVVAVVLAMAGPSLGASTEATVKVVVRPVTAGGVPAAGFHEIKDNQQSDAVDCRSPNPSPGAASQNIEWCSPSAAYAIACWKAASPHRVLCSRDPSSKQVYSIPRSGRFAKTSPEGKKNRAPILLILRDGTRCFYRDGGAWGQLKSHPNWRGAYSCDQHGDVWSPPDAPHNGVNESRPVWTVRTASGSGSGQVTVRRVRKAYFVGTAAAGG